MGRLDVKLLLTALQELIHAEEAKNQALGKLVKEVAKLVPKDKTKLTRSNND